MISCLDGSPAARAGIQEGDELLEIDGQSITRVHHFISMLIFLYLVFNFSMNNSEYETFIFLFLSFQVKNS